MNFESKLQKSIMIFVLQRILFYTKNLDVAKLLK